MPGPPRKPSKLEELQGNPGHRKKNTGEPEPESAIPDCPPELKGDSRKEWDRISPLLLELGLLSKIDRSALSMYCQAWGQWLACQRRINSEGLRKKVNGQIVPNPSHSIAIKLADQIRRWLAEFGLTPASRAKLHVNREADNDPLEDFLKLEP